VSEVGRAAQTPGLGRRASPSRQRRATKPPAAPRLGRTAQEVAEAIGFHSGLVAAIVEDEVKRGHVERTSDGYRLTPLAAEKLAPCLSLFGEPRA
jgi:hypothetical protein